METVKNIIKYCSEIGIAIFSFCLSIIFWRFDPKGSIPTWIFVLTTGILFIISIIALKWGFSEKKTKITLPTLINIIDDMWIFEASDIFVQQSYASIYKKDNGAERLFAVGVIETITDTGNIQIRPVKCLYEDSKKNLLKVKDKIVLKPNISPLVLNNLPTEEQNV